MAKGTCSINQCERPVKYRGWCGRHYSRWQRTGDPEGSIPRRITPPERRFWPKVNKDSPVPDFAPHLGPCWIWTACRFAKTGYGAFGHQRKLVGAHRFAYELVVGPVPDGLELDHLCRVRACVNPAHLEPVTHLENMMRGVSIQAVNARKTHCKRGHEFTPENTIRTKAGNRCCLTCHRDWPRIKRENAALRASLA